MNVTKLAQAYEKAAAAVGKLVKEASATLGAKIRVDLPVGNVPPTKNGFFVIVDGRSYEFESLKESLEFLEDLANPVLNDTELLNALDEAFPGGWRLCLEHGLCPIEPDYCLTGCKHLNFQGSIRDCLNRIHEKADCECGGECC